MVREGDSEWRVIAKPLHYLETFNQSCHVIVLYYTYEMARTDEGKNYIRTYLVSFTLALNS